MLKRGVVSALARWEETGGGPAVAILDFLFFPLLSVLTKVFSSNSFHEPVGVYQQTDPCSKGRWYALGT